MPKENTYPILGLFYRNGLAWNDLHVTANASFVYPSVHKVLEAFARELGGWKQGDKWLFTIFSSANAEAVQATLKSLLDR